LCQAGLVVDAKEGFNFALVDGHRDLIFSGPMEEKINGPGCDKGHIAAYDEIALGIGMAQGGMYTTGRTTVFYDIRNQFQVEACIIRVIGYDDDLVNNRSELVNDLLRDGFTAKEDEPLVGSHS
jgi:hypothetical protein